jgi:hypothetical protein
MLDSPCLTPRQAMLLRLNLVLALRRASASAAACAHGYWKYGITCSPQSLIESMIFWCGIS